MKINILSSIILVVILCACTPQISSYNDLIKLNKDYSYDQFKLDFEGSIYSNFHLGTVKESGNTYIIKHIKVSSSIQMKIVGNSGAASHNNGGGSINYGETSGSRGQETSLKDNYFVVFGENRKMIFSGLLYEFKISDSKIINDIGDIIYDRIKPKKSIFSFDFE